MAFAAATDDTRPVLAGVLMRMKGKTATFAAADDTAAPASSDQTPDYTRDVAPLLTKYCAGCHNDTEREGEFSLQSYESLRKGTGDGPAVLAGNADSSRLIRVLTGGEPAMPPEGEETLNDEQISWFVAGGALNIIRQRAG